MHYVRAKIADDDERMTYRAYVAESLRLQGENKYIAKSWLDIIDPKPVDTRSGDDIALQVVNGAGLTYTGGD